MSCILPLYASAVAGTAMALGIGGMISGFRSQSIGNGFWDGFANYLNENWSQTLSLDIALAMVTFGISQAVAAIQRVSASKKALANAAERSKEAAVARAKELKRLPRSKRPAMTSAVVDVKSGAIYYGDSGGGLPSDINLILGNQMPTFTSEKWIVANCAEFKAVNNALNAGAKMQNLVVTTVRVNTLTLAPMCKNCQVSIQGVLLVVSG